MLFPQRLHIKQQNFSLASRSSPGLQRDIRISTLPITKGGSRGCSTDTMRRPRDEIGGCRARGRALLMVRAVSMDCPLTRPRSLQRALQMMKEHAKHLRPNISLFVERAFGLWSARGGSCLPDHLGGLLPAVHFIFLSHPPSLRKRSMKLIWVDWVIL